MTELFVKMDIATIKGGVIMKVGGVRNFTILSVLATYANNKGEAYPSQETIAEMVGCSRQTVNKAIKEIRGIMIDGEPILQVEQTNSTNGVRNVYTLSRKTGFWFGKSVDIKQSKSEQRDKGLSENESVGCQNSLHEEESNKQEPLEQEPKEKENTTVVFDNAKQVLIYFKEQYFKTYNVAYSPNWGRDTSIIKNKLMDSFTGEEIKSMIDVAFEEYESRWANAKFPRVTIGQICSWLGNEALTIASKRSNQAKQVDVDSSKYDYDFDRLDELLDM